MNSIKYVIFGLFIGYVLNQIYNTTMYNIKLADFYGEDYSFSQKGIVLNGSIANGQMISVRDLEALSPGDGLHTVPELCPHITSKRGHNTLSFVGDISVCCWVADEKQWLVPYKDVGENRHYLCGKYPHLDHVIQPLTKTVI